MHVRCTGCGHAAASKAKRAKRASNAIQERRTPRRAPVGAVGKDVHYFNQTPRLRDQHGQHAVGEILHGHGELRQLIFDTVLLLDAVFLAVFLVLKRKWAPTSFSPCEVAKRSVTSADSHASASFLRINLIFPQVLLYTKLCIKTTVCLPASCLHGGRVLRRRANYLMLGL